MYRTGTLGLSLPVSLVTTDNTVLRPRVTYEVRITDTYSYYEFKCRLCVYGSRMVTGIYYNLSYAPAIDRSIILLMITVATPINMRFYLWISPIHSKAASSMIP